MSDPSALWTKLSEIINKPAAVPTMIPILRSHIDTNQKGELDTPFVKDNHYFQVMINELFLSNSRKWFNEIDPIVYVVSEFMYNGKPQKVPYIVGPSMLKQIGVPDEYSGGVIYKNTSVTGLKPYRGGGLTMTVVLCQSNNNLLRPLIQVIENAAKALDFSPVLSPYTKIAEVVMNGFETCFNSGGITPLVGIHDSFGPNFNIAFMPSYFALINKPGISPDRLWVCQNQLMIGDTLSSAEPFRQADYVLYSITSPVGNSRDDLDSLPFIEIWQKVKLEAGSPVDDPNYKNAKVMMSNLYQMIVTNPDLTDLQSDALADTYAARMKDIHDHAKKFSGDLGANEQGGESSRIDSAKKKAMDILNW